MIDVAKEQLCGHFVSPATRELEETFSVRSVLGLVAEDKDSSGNERKGNVRCWKPLPSNG
jgi:hypothetical protein